MKKINTLIKIIAVLLITLTSCKEKSSNKHYPADKIDTTQFDLSYLEPLHTRKTFKRQDISLSEYINSNPNKPDSIKKVIYIIPFGNMKPEIEEIIKNETEYLEIFFQLKVVVMDRVSYDDIKKIDSIKTRLVPDSDYGFYSKMKKGLIENLREQIEASSFMDNYLLKNKPKDAIAVLGITEHDIYNPGYNYLFGSSRLNDGVGLISTFRLIDYGDSTKHNIRKVSSKQIANMFSIKNVKDYECLLNFHINKKELENGEFKISPKALEKLKYCIGFDYNKRFSELADFWKKEENEKTYNYYEKCIELSQKSNPIK